MSVAKTVLRAGMWEFARALGILQREEKAMRGTLCILTYHRVLEDKDASGYPLPSLAMPRSAFEEQVEFFSTRYKCSVLSEALKAQSSPHQETPSIAFTFDDGYLDNYDLAAPILEQHGIRGTFFVTESIVTQSLHWYDLAILVWEQLDHQSLIDQAHELGLQSQTDPTDVREWVQALKTMPSTAREIFLRRFQQVKPDPRFQFFTGAQAFDLQQRGHEIQSHTLTHPLLPQLNDDEIYHQLHDSRELLRSLGIDATGLCYPNGDHSERVREIAKQCGYQFGCTTRPGRNTLLTDPFQLRRIDMNPKRLMMPLCSSDLAIRSHISFGSRS